MFLAIFKETAKKIVRNKKNRLILILSVIGIVLYATLAVSDNENILTVDKDQIELETYAEYGQKESRLDAGDIAVNSFTGLDTYSMAKREYELNYSFLKAINEGDITRLVDLQTSQTPSFLMEDVHKYLDEKYAGDFQMKEFERVAIFQQMDALAELDSVNTHIYNNKSAFQQLHSFFTGFGPLIILFLTIFVASEILTDDRKHRTIKSGQPLGFRKYIFYQSVTVFLIMTAVTAALVTLFILVTGLLYGFGPLSLDVTQYAYQDGYRGEETNFFDIPLSTFLIQSGVLTVILIYLFIRINAVLSLVFRHDIVVMIIGFLLVAFNRIYSGGSEETLLGLPAHIFPQNYFEFGNILNGVQNYLTMSDRFTFMNGLIVLAVTIVVIEIILYIIIFWMDRQKFERAVG
ncbi:ABC transporter permease [Salinicoccus sp. YB14-2]|uniref:ABC transporter permease n=1 Tax=Salinicoccus sp. YB14-2 TaxID=1572701 RepID=UPI00068DB3E5|nr:ABC transporter permease [Salinicoccus sp. YB14-2]